MVTHVVLAADLDTVADASKAAVGEGSAGDIVLVAILVVAAVERLPVTALHVLAVVVVVLVGGLLGLRRLGVLGPGVGSLATGKGKCTSGESEDGNSGELHVEGLENCLSRKESVEK